MKSLRNLHLVGATGQLRTAIYDGREYLVVPVVAMTEGVVWAMNSEFPEMVYADELAIAPQQWNGRGGFAGHPAVNNIQVSGNTPSVLEKSFGLVFNTASPEKIIAEKRLTFDVYLDPTKALVVGEEAVSVIERLRAGQTVEVSIGCYVLSEQTEGVYDDKPYVGVWREITSDHIAFLSANDVGACSIEAGCGALRQNAMRSTVRQDVRHLVTAKGLTLMKDDKTADTEVVPSLEKRSLKERLTGMFASMRRAVAVEGVSNSDIRNALDTLLRADEPGYMWIEEVYQAEQTVIYCVAPSDSYELYRRKYTVDANGVPSLVARKQKVEPVTDYQVVAAAEKSPDDAEKPPATASQPKPVGTCGCGGNLPTTAITHSSGDPNMKTKAERIKALIDNPKTPFVSGDEKMLDAATDERLDALETMGVEEPKAAPVAEPVAAPAAAAAHVEAPVKVKTDAEYLAELPVNMRSAVNRAMAAEVARKNAYVASLKDAQKVYSEEKLQAMSIEQLEEIQQLVAASKPAMDYSLANGAPRVAGENYEPPDSYAVQTSKAVN